MGVRKDLGRPLARVLVVDDLAMLRQGVRIVLEDAGFDVQEVGSGEEALSVLKEGDFDLVMTDLAMPGMTGIEWVKKAAPPKDGRPVYLMMSAKIEPREIEEAKAIGVQEILRKPYRREALIAKVDQMLGIDRKAVLKEIEEKQAALRATVRAERERKKKVVQEKGEKGGKGEKGKEGDAEGKSAKEPSSGH